MKYNRAFIIRNEKSLPFLEDFNLGEDEEAYWLFESEESFHGEHDNKFFYFKDIRLDSRLKLPLDCVELEFTEDEIETRQLLLSNDYEVKMDFKVGDKVEYCGNIGEIYRIQEDKYFPMICVQFENINPNSEYKHKYLEFDLTGRTHSWTALPAITKIR